MTASVNDCAPERAIHSFHRDNHGDWFARLECGHHQHVRHNPPWIDRSWIESSFGRMVMLGQHLTCIKCAVASPQDELLRLDHD
ncbi:MAG: DUF3565 domain-containing protein [Halothiobacillus sp.]